MCYHSIRLKNPTKDFDYKKDKVYNTVPCNRCGECLTNKQNEWKVRSFYEYLDTKNKGGHTIFVTFTYNEESVPHYQVGENWYRCFDKSHIQNFNKNIRHSLESYGFVLPNKNRDNDFDLEYKYIFTSEYGKRFTKRPHYHALLFFKGDINPSLSRTIIRDNWNYGFLQFGDNQGVVYGDGACKYVTKYITKDIDFLETFEQVLESDDDEVIENFKRFNQFHLQSQGFGLSALDNVPDVNLILGKIFVPNTDPSKCYISIPLYLDRKAFYKIVYRYPDGIYETIKPNTKVGIDCFPKYVLTERGQQMKSLRYQCNKDKLVDKYNDVVNSVLSVEDGFLLQLNEYTKHQFDSIEDFQAECRCLLGDRDLSDFVSYVSNFKDKVIDSYIDDISIVKDVELDFIDYRSSLPNLVTNVELNINQCDDLVCTDCYNQLPIFKDFDLLNEYLSAFTLVQGIYRNKTFFRKYLELKQLKRD